MNQQTHLRFCAGLDLPPGAGIVCARDGRSAVWMAAGYALTSGRESHVTVGTAFDFRLACTVEVDVPVEIVFERDGSIVERALHLPSFSAATADLRRWEPLASQLADLLPLGSVLCVERDSLGVAALKACETRPDVTVAHSGSRGSAVAFAIGAKAGAPSATVAALCDAASMAIGGGDLEAAGRERLAVAIVVANDAPEPAPYELLAGLAGGHGEVVGDPGKLALHLRNSLAATIPSVVNAILHVRRDASVARLF